MIKHKRAYRFKYEPTSGLFDGITRDLEYPYATDEQPEYHPESRTVFDTNLNKWKLISREDFWELVRARNEIIAYESKLEPVLTRNFAFIEKRLSNIIVSADTYDDLSVKRDESLKKLLADSSERTTNLSVQVKQFDLRIYNLAARLELQIEKINNLHILIQEIHSFTIPWYLRLYRWLVR